MTRFGKPSLHGACENPKSISAREELDVMTRTNAGHMDELQKAFDQVKALAKEKARRVYYQDIVYKVCNALDRHQGSPPGRGLLVGTIEEPSDEVQKRLSEELRVQRELETFLQASNDARAMLGQWNCGLADALKQMLHYFGNPQREEWLTDNNFARACEAAEGAKQALKDFGPKVTQL